MWFLLFFIVIPFILFIGFLVFSILAIFLIDRIFHKKYSQYFSLILPCFSLIFYFMLIMGGISFKSIDPQYYEFKKLCANVDSEVVIHNQDYFDIIKNRKNIETDDKGCFYSEKLQQEICFGGFQMETYIEYDKGRLSKTSIKEYYNRVHFATYTKYRYDYTNLRLAGDEGAGFYIELANDLSSCSYLKKNFGNSW